MKMTAENNICRVFELPADYPSEFCPAGGLEVNFRMVDWFNPINPVDIAHGNVKDWAEYATMLEDFIAKKNYIKPGRKYLLITGFDELIIVGDSNDQ